MKKYKNRYYKIISATILLLLFLPLGQETFKFFKINPLKGEFQKYSMPRFTIDAWLNNSFQDTTEKFTKLNFGFSPLITRLHNQYVFEMFHNTRSPSVVIGKQNEIYDYGHIQAYLGNDFLGEKVIENKIRQIDEINEALKKFNTEIILVLAPSKPSIVPEYLPSKYQQTRTLNNYQYYQHKLKQSQLKYVDFSSVFKTWKNTKPLPLYPQCGVHWSEYGATLAADSMLRFIKSNISHELPLLRIDSIPISDKLSKSDYDMGSILNLLFPIKAYPMGYPSVSFDGEPSKSLDVLTIGDSYYWIWFNVVGFDQHCFKSNLFLEYFSKAHSTGFGNKSISDINIIEESMNSEIILIVCSESNLYRMGFGYIETMHYLIPKINQRYQQKLDEYRKSIYQDEQWMRSIREKAKNKAIDVDSMVTLDAIYLIEQN